MLKYSARPRLDWALIALLLSTPLAKVHAIQILRLPAPGKSRPRRVCENLMTALKDVPESYEPHHVPAFFATFNSFLEPLLVGLDKYEEPATLKPLKPKAFGSHVMNRRLHLSIRLAKLFQLYKKNQHDHELAKFLLALTELNQDGATGAQPADLGGPTPKWKRPGDDVLPTLEQRLKDLHRSWEIFEPKEREAVLRWLGTVFYDGFQRTTVRAWRCDPLTQRRCQSGPPVHRTLPEIREVGLRLVRLYGLDLADEPQAFEPALRDFLLFLQR